MFFFDNYFDSVSFYVRIIYFKNRLFYFTRIKQIIWNICLYDFFMYNINNNNIKIKCYRIMPLKLSIVSVTNLFLLPMDIYFKNSDTGWRS